MRSSWVILVAALAGACSSSPDFCDQYSTAFTAQENSISGCTPDSGDATGAVGVLSGEFPFSTTACERQLPSCDPADVQQLNATLKCVKALPIFQCAWLDETDGGDTEADAGGLAGYQSDVQQCEAPTISAACQGGLDAGGCGTETHAPDNVSSQPLPLNLGLPTTDCLGAHDTHYLSITAPSTPSAGGYFEIGFDNITQDVQGQLVIQLADVNDNPLDNAKYEVDAKAGIFLAAEPSTTFLIEISSDSGNIPLGYTITVNFVGINDSYKPDRAPPGKPLTLAQASTGSYCWAGQVSSLALVPTEGGDFDDWFSVAMPGPGTATIQLLGYPGDFAPGAEFDDQTLTIIEPETCSGCTGNHTNQFNLPLYYKAPVTAAGTYYVHVFPYQYNRQTYSNYSMGTLQATPVLPAHFTTPYNLTVTFSTP